MKETGRQKEGERERQIDKQTDTDTDTDTEKCRYTQIYRYINVDILRGILTHKGQHTQIHIYLFMWVYIYMDTNFKIYLRFVTEYSCIASHLLVSLEYWFQDSSPLFTVLTSIHRCLSPICSVCTYSTHTLLCKSLLDMHNP